MVSYVSLSELATPIFFKQELRPVSGSDGSVMSFYLNLVTESLPVAAAHDKSPWLGSGDRPAVGAGAGGGMWDLFHTGASFSCFEWLAIWVLFSP